MHPNDSKNAGFIAFSRTKKYGKIPRVEIETDVFLGYLKLWAASILISLFVLHFNCLSVIMIKMSSGSCQAVVRQLSGSHQAVVRHCQALSGSRKAVLRQSSYSHQAAFKVLLESHKAVVGMFLSKAVMK